MNFQPLGKRVLIERTEEAKTTASGIIIPDSATEKPSQGKVVAVSTEVENVKVDDVVIFGKYAGNEFKVGGEAFLILDVEDLFGIIK